MSEEESKTIDQSQTTDPGVSEPEPKTPKKRALDGIKREIDEKDLKNNRAAVSLILDNNDRLENDVKELKDFRDKYYETKALADVLKERLKALTPQQLAIYISGILAGYIPSLWSNQGLVGLFAVGSLVLAYVGFFKKSK